MIIETFRYVCDWCRAAAGDGGHERPEDAWAVAAAAGWQAQDRPADHTGHVPSQHLCKACVQARGQLARWADEHADRLVAKMAARR